MFWFTSLCFDGSRFWFAGHRSFVLIHKYMFWFTRSMFWFICSMFWFTGQVFYVRIICSATPSYPFFLQARKSRALVNEGCSQSVIYHDQCLQRTEFIRGVGRSNTIVLQKHCFSSPRGKPPPAHRIANSFRPLEVDAHVVCRGVRQRLVSEWLKGLRGALVPEGPEVTRFQMSPVVFRRPPKEGENKNKSGIWRS